MTDGDLPYLEDANETVTLLEQLIRQLARGAELALLGGERFLGLGVKRWIFWMDFFLTSYVWVRTCLKNGIEGE